MDLGRCLPASVLFNDLDQTILCSLASVDMGQPQSIPIHGSPRELHKVSRTQAVPGRRENQVAGAKDRGGG